LGKLGGTALQAKLVKEFGKEGAQEYCVALGKMGGNALQARLVEKHGEEGAHYYRAALGNAAKTKTAYYPAPWNPVLCPCPAKECPAGHPILFYPDFCSFSHPVSWGLSFLAGKPVLQQL
jgi:hypothetical protein